MTEPSISTHLCSPQALDLSAPRVAPRIRKSSKKNPNGISNRDIPLTTAPLKEHSSDLNEKSPDLRILSEARDSAAQNDKETIIAPEESLVEQLDLPTLWKEDFPVRADDGSRTQAALEHINETSSEIKTQMLLSAHRTAIAKAAANEETKQPEQQQHCGSMKAVENTLGKLYDASAAWLSSQEKCGAFSCLNTRASSTVSDDSVEEPKAADYLDQSKHVAQRSRNNVLDDYPPKMYYTEEPEKSQVHYFATEPLEETSSSFSTSTSDGDLNSYHCDKSIAATAATLQSFHEDDDAALFQQQDEKVVKRVLWKRLFCSKARSTTAVDDPRLGSVHMNGEASLDNDDQGSFNETLSPTPVLDDIHLQITAKKEIDHIQGKDPETQVEDFETVLGSVSPDTFTEEAVGFDDTLLHKFSTTTKKGVSNDAGSNATPLATTGIDDIIIASVEQPLSFLETIRSESSAGSNKSDWTQDFHAVVPPSPFQRVLGGNARRLNSNSKTTMMNLVVKQQIEI